MVSAPSQAGEQSFEGIVSAAQTLGGISTQTLYTRKGSELRIENPDKSKPKPVNIVDLVAGKLTIVYPHNSSFVVIDLTKNDAPPAAPNLPPGFPSPPTISPPPGFPTPPPMPSRPPMPNPAAAGPMMPPMPAMGGFGAAPELKKTDKARKIQGFDCTLYTISDRRGTFEIWATPDSGLFPFRSIQLTSQDRHFGPRMLADQWGDLLRKQSLFPLEATLRTGPHLPPGSEAKATSTANPGASPRQSEEQLSFRVDKIERKKIDDEKLFQPPAGYSESQAPQL